jgi:hypothetical protein
VIKNVVVVEIVSPCKTPVSSNKYDPILVVLSVLTVRVRAELLKLNIVSSIGAPYLLVREYDMLVHTPVPAVKAVKDFTRAGAATLYDPAVIVEADID